MKLQKLTIENLGDFRLERSSSIMGGYGSTSTCLGTCCPDDGKTGCEDWEDDTD